MNWHKVIAELEAIALSEAKLANNNLSRALNEGGVNYNRGEELLAVANRQKIGANILLQLSQALAKGLQK